MYNVNFPIIVQSINTINPVWKQQFVTTKYNNSEHSLYACFCNSSLNTAECCPSTHCRTNLMPCFGLGGFR
jgi:hypothetical protein